MLVSLEIECYVQTFKSGKKHCISGDRVSVFACSEIRRIVLGLLSYLLQSHKYGVLFSLSFKVQSTSIGKEWRLTQKHQKMLQ